ncbi:TonB-dependent receptor [Mangrovimonas cancribranchiae]|uniref:TonB-dependent receptor n=1 Tax=Mangrovimonas cancribranchiae TaxID=3080055 RepID=A0AAU6P739_9FLAO
MKYFWTLVFFLIVGVAFSQQIKVLDKVTKQPIPGVTIYNTLKNISTITNFDGEANISEFLENDNIIFNHMLYQDLSMKKSQIGSIVYLTPTVEGLDEVFIAASKFEQKKKDIPQKIISIHKEDIAFNAPQTSADLLENTGAVYVQKSQLGGGSPMIRGFSTNRLLITVDGVRMNNAIFRSGNLQNVISIDPFSVARTEISLGAGSVVYGSDAVGGVMGFYTKKPQLSYTNTLKLEVNTTARYATANQEKTGHFDVNFGFKKWAFLTSVSYSDFDDLRMGSHGPKDYLRPEYVVQDHTGNDYIKHNDNPKVQKPTGYNQTHVVQKVAFQPNNNVTFDLGLHFSETSNYPRYDRLIRYRGENLRSAEWYYGPQKWFMGNLQFTKLSSRSNLYDKVQTTLAYQSFTESRHDRDYQSSIKNIREEQVDALSFNADFEKLLSQKTELFYGAEYVFNKVSSKGKEQNIVNGITNNTVSRYPDNSNWQSAAAYLNLKYKPREQFILQSGLRYNYISTYADFSDNNTFLNLPFNDTKINSDALTGSLGVSWIPNEVMRWKIHTSTAFRAPNIDDVGKVFDSEPGSVVVPNNHLKPEYAYNAEIGLGLNFNQIFLIDLATYYTYLDNALVRRDYSLNGESQIMYDGELSNIQAIQNGSHANIYGFEMGLQLHISNQLKLTSQYNVIGGNEDDNGKDVPVRHVVPQFGNTHVIWENKKLKVDFYANYNGELSHNQLALSEQGKAYMYALDANGNPYAPSWYTVNLKTKYNLSPSTTIIAGLENITDQRYKTYSSGIASAGRNFLVSLTYSL